MAITTIRRIMNETDSPVTLRNFERPADGVRKVEGHRDMAIDWNIPWCHSPEEFANGKRLVLRFPYNGRVLEYSIWQSGLSDGDFVRFTDDEAGLTQYTYRDVDQSDARKALANQAGELYRVTGDSRTVLHVKPLHGGVWVILTRV